MGYNLFPWVSDAPVSNPQNVMHLIVTVLFALCTIISIMGFVAFSSIGIALLFVALMCLLVPYIVHYFHLENGVQTLYKFYDKLK